MNLGTLPADTFKLGATQVNKVMLGDVEVWSDGPQNLIPKLTSYEDGIGFVAASNREDTAWKVFDRDVNSFWTIISGVVGDYVSYSFVEPVFVGNLAASASMGQTGFFEVQASITGVWGGEEIVLCSFSGNGAGYAGPALTSGEYQHFRIVATEHQSGSVSVASLALFA